MMQKYSNGILGTLVVIVVGLMLALIAGCSEKESNEPSGVEETNEELTAEETAAETEEVDEPELPDTEVQEIQNSDITEETTSEVEETETVSEETAANLTGEVEEVSTVGETTTETTESEETPAEEEYKVISIKGYKAYPEEMTIKPGTTVEWRNVNDKLLHIIGWNGQKQDGVKPEPLKIGESWSYKFEKPGKIVWFSTARPTVQGTIYIEE
jgi:plastocyanin